MFIFCINCYQDIDLIGDCIDAIRESVGSQEHRIVAVDGVYKSFAEQAKIEAAKMYSVGNNSLGDSFMRFTEPISTDGTIKVLIDKKVDVIIQSNRPWKDEIEKRSKYFIGSDGDYYVVIDSDEKMVGKFPDIEYLRRSDNWCLNLQRDDKIPVYPVFRVYKHYDGIKHIGFHNGPNVPCGFKNGKIEYKLLKKVDYEKDWVVPGILLEHRWSERGTKDQIRHQAKGAYYRRLLEEEAAYRDQHGV